MSEQQCTWFRQDNKKRGGLYKKIEIADTAEPLENEFKEHCIACHFGIWITTIGTEEKKRRYFMSQNIVKNLKTIMDNSDLDLTDQKTKYLQELTALGINRPVGRGGGVRPPLFGDRSNFYQFHSSGN